MTEGPSYNKALSYAYRLFKYRPRSRKELQERLKLRGCNASIIDRVVAALEREGLIDDKQFAKLWALNRIQLKPSSLTIIRQELLTKGIDAQIIDDTLEQLKKDFNEYEIARDLTEKRLRLLTGVKKLKAKKRLFDYLRRRGFSFDVVYKVLNEVYNDA